jgi:hypothetical protein
VHDSTKATPRLLTAAAVTFAVLALAAFAWFAGGATAGAAGTSSGTSGQLRPVQDQPQAQDGAPADRPGGGHPCPEEPGGSGQGSGTGSGSGSSSTPEAPATGTPSTPL